MNPERRHDAELLNEFLDREESADRLYEEHKAKAADMLQHDAEYNPFTPDNFLEALGQAEQKLVAQFIGELLFQDKPSTGIKIARDYWFRLAMDYLDRQQR